MMSGQGVISVTNPLIEEKRKLAKKVAMKRKNIINWIDTWAFDSDNIYFFIMQ